MMTKKAAEFDQADLDGDHEIEYEEFCLMMPRTRGGTQQSDEDLRVWWEMLDTNGDGVITKDEFFIYALASSSRKTGSGVVGMFQKFDANRSGKLDEIEFTHAVEEMGFGDVATELFDAHKLTSTLREALGVEVSMQQVSYLTLLNSVNETLVTPEMRSFLFALSHDHFLKVDTRDWSFTGTDPDSARDALQVMLKKHKVRMGDLFAQRMLP